jgi:uncharacterized protein
MVVLSSLVGFTIGALALVMVFSFWNGSFGAWYNSKNDLYSARTIVTGQRDETRVPAFLVALLDVAKKVSGDHNLTAAQIESIAHGNVKTYVTAFHDHDRMEDIPIHDEQGTRDRSFDLFVDFAPHKVDALLKVLGRKPWLTDRPKILVLLKVKNATGEYLLVDDEDDWQGAEQREAFQNSAWQAGMPLVLPTPAILKTFQLDTVSFENITTDQLKLLMHEAKADNVVAGHLIWIGGPNGWKADWTLHNNQSAHHWTIEATNFDGAFRNAMRGVAQILSGHGEPTPNLN